MPDVGKAVTRRELYDAVYRKVGLSRTESSAFVELVLEEITVRKKGQRMGRNPKTGVDVPISPRRVVVFKASAIMKQRINGGRPLQKKTSKRETLPIDKTGNAGA